MVLLWSAARGLAEVVRLDRAAGAHGLGVPDRGVAGRLGLELAVHLGAEDDGEGGDGQPQHEHDHGADAAVGLPVAAEVRHVDREGDARSDEHTSEHQSLMRISYAVFCLKKKKKRTNTKYETQNPKDLRYKHEDTP